MANQFVGEIERLVGRSNPAWGTLTVLIKNGAPAHVYVPGERLSRGLNAPLFGVLELVQVRTDDVPIKLSFEDIVTKSIENGQVEGYAIPHLSLSVNVRINPADNYAAFKAHIRTHGPQFADALIAEISNGLNSRLRSTLAQRTIAELREGSLSDVLGASRTPFQFSSGVLLVTSLVASVREWPAAYVEIVKTKQGTAVGVAQAESDRTIGVAEIETTLTRVLGEARIEATTLQERVKLLTPVAHELGLPVEYLVNPSHRESIESRASEILNNVLQSPNGQILRQNPALLSVLLGNTGLGAPRLQQSPSPSSYSGEAAQALDSSPMTGPIDAEELGIIPGAPVLTIDRRLGMVWEGVYGGLGDTNLLGLGSGASGDSAAVVVVSEGTQGSEAQHAQFVNRLRRLLKASEVKTLWLSPADSSGLIKQWLVAAHGTSAEGLTVTSELVDEHGLLTLNAFVGGEASLARDVVRSLLSPERAELPALVSVLPYADLRLYAGQSGSV